MNKSAFTMVELIFVIVIIGILSAVALPKFGDITDKAKINSELAQVDSLNSAIVAAVEFRLDDYGTADIDWHNLGDEADANGTDIKAALRKANTNKSVLGGIAKKNEKLKVIQVATLDKDGNHKSGANASKNKLYYSPLLITGVASDGLTGVKVPKNAPGSDIVGKPDKNDYWIFNPTSFDINVSGNANGGNTVVVEAGSIKLIDVNGTVGFHEANFRSNVVIHCYNQNGRGATNFVSID